MLWQLARSRVCKGRPHGSPNRNVGYREARNGVVGGDLHAAQKQPRTPQQVLGDGAALAHHAEHGLQGLDLAGEFAKVLGGLELGRGKASCNAGYKMDGCRRGPMRSGAERLGRCRILRDPCSKRFMNRLAGVV